MRDWQVYILRCGDGTLYTGITVDLPKRLDAHERGTAAKYTRTRRPVTLAYQETQPDRGSALRREAALKKLGRAKKLALIAPVVVALLLGSLAVGDDPVARAQALLQQGKYGAALHELDPVLAHDKENIAARMVAAAACVGAGDGEGAQAHLKWVGQVDPATQGYDLLRGRALLLQADTAAEAKKDKRQRELASDAADAFAKALVESPHQTSILALRAMALRAAGKNGEAREAYADWINASPRDPNAYGATAAFFAEIGAWSETSALIERAPQDDPRLLHDLRTSVLLNGFTVVPWASLKPLYDTVSTEETDPKAKQRLEAMRAIVTTDGSPSLLAVLDYLDIDPDDRLNVRTKVLSETLPATSTNVEGLVAPQPVSRPAAVYPDIARRARIQGAVIMLVRIRKDGTVGSMHLLATSNPMFNEAALTAVRQWRWTPGTMKGEPIEVPYVARVDFRLK